MKFSECFIPKIITADAATDKFYALSFEDKQKLIEDYIRHEGDNFPIKYRTYYTNMVFMYFEHDVNFGKRVVSLIGDNIDEVTTGKIRALYKMLQNDNASKWPTDILSFISGLAMQIYRKSET